MCPTGQRDNPMVKNIVDASQYTPEPEYLSPSSLTDCSLDQVVSAINGYLQCFNQVGDKCVGAD